MTLYASVCKKGNLGPDTNNVNEILVIYDTCVNMQNK